MSKPTRRRDDDEPEDSGGSYSFRYDKPKKKKELQSRREHSDEDSEPEDKGYSIDEEPKQNGRRGEVRPFNRIPKKKKKLKPRRESEEGVDWRAWAWILFILTGVGIFMAWTFIKKEIQQDRVDQAQSRFGNAIAEYSQPPVSIYPFSQRPPVKGKFMLVNLQTNRVDDFYGEIDEKFRAEKPDEVGTIVQLRWEHRLVGRYTGGGEAKQWFCTIQLIDKASKVGYPPKQIAGPSPPSSTKSSSDTGRKPYEEITKYLEAMMRDGNTP